MNCIQWFLYEERPRTVALYVVSFMALFTTLADLLKGWDRPSLSPEGWLVILIPGIFSTALARLAKGGKKWTLANIVAKHQEFTINVESAINNAPVADFSYSPSNPVVRQTVSFIDLSTDADIEFGDSLTYNWEFGDRSTSTAQNPTHVYTVAGTYNVTLISINGFGADTIIKNNLVTVIKQLRRRKKK